MEKLFAIPISNQDLLNYSQESFHVTQTFNSDSVPGLLLEIKEKLNDPYVIYSKFNNFYAVLDNHLNLSTSTILRSFDLIYAVVDRLGSNVTKFLEESIVSNEIRVKYLNVTKMSMFMVCAYIKMIDKIVYTSESQKKGRKDDDCFDQPQWDAKRLSGLVQIFNILQLPLSSLWDPPVVEEQFTDLFCSLCYRTLEQGHNKTKQITNTTFQILGVAIKKYNHGMTCSSKLLQILRNYEHAAVPVANGIHILLKEYGIASLFPTLVKEIVDDLCTDEADLQTSKNYSIFFNELNVISPQLIMPHLQYVSDELLSNNSFSLRNCILKLLGDVILNQLTSEELTEEMKKERDDFLGNLFGHIMDVNSHVRSKVINIFYTLKEAHAIPLSYHYKILDLTVERLEDKSSLVRKNAVVLIKTFLERNPFGHNLSRNELLEKIESVSKKLEEYNEALIEMRKNFLVMEEVFDTELEPCFKDIISQLHTNSFEETNFETLVGGAADLGAKVKDYILTGHLENAFKLVQLIDIKAGNEEAVKKLDVELMHVYYIQLLRTYYIGSEEKQMIDQYLDQEKVFHFMEDSLKFSDKITSALPKIEEYLKSKINSDVNEAISFFTTGYLFGISGTEIGMMKALNLVWSSDKEKQDAVKAAYYRLFFETSKTGRAHALAVVQKLSNFFDNLTKGYYFAYEILIRDWVKSGIIDNQIIQVMFERFTFKIETTTEDEARRSLQLLVIASSENHLIVQQNVTLIEEFGISEYGMKDVRVYSAILSLLTHLVPLSTRENTFQKRIDLSNSLIAKVLETFKILWWDRTIQNFDSITSKLFDFIYRVGLAPDTISEQLLNDILKEIEVKSDGYLTDEDTNNNEVNLLKLPTYMMSRLIHLIGYLAMKEMIFLDIDIFCNARYRNELSKNIKNSLELSKPMIWNDSSSKSAYRKNSLSSIKDDVTDSPTCNEAEDRIIETITFICEKVLIYSNAVVFHSFVSSVFEICKHPKYYDVHTYHAAITAMLRFMFVSADFCEEHMTTLMHILTESKYTVIRKNILVGISDLMLRFPNIVGLHTKNIYSILYDKDEEIRYLTVKILSFLIIQEMIRVKGQIADLALCIVDRNSAVKEAVQTLFQEIGTKPNTLYNVLPDIISRLGDMESILEEEKYRTIIRFIFGLIEKNRHLESIVDKLCFRFKITTSERQWRDTVFCLSQITHTEKTISKMIEHIPLYKDKVQIDEVYDGFKLIINSSNKLFKNESKQLLVEFEKKLDECLNVNENVSSRKISNDSNKRCIQSTPNSKSVGKNKNAKANRSQKKGKQKVQSSDEENDSEIEQVIVKSSRKTRSQRQFFY